MAVHKNGNRCKKALIEVIVHGTSTGKGYLPFPGRASEKDTDSNFHKQLSLNLQLIGAGQRLKKLDGTMTHREAIAALN